jgi:hypothetical protein
MPLVGFVDLNLDCKVQRLAMANPHPTITAQGCRLDLWTIDAD